MTRKLLFLSCSLALLWSCEREHLHHDVSVDKGLGSGNYRLGSEVNIVADTPEIRFQFDRWEGDVFLLDQPGQANTSFRMPLQDVFFRATYREVPYFLLDVIAGQGSGSYPAGERLPIEADQPQAGYGFRAWMGDTDVLDDSLSAYTFLTMPARDVRITADFHPTSTFQLQVIDGAGGGQYFPEESIQIFADQHRTEYVFQRWTGDTMFLDRTDSVFALVTMPNRDLHVTATYLEIKIISFDKDVMPLIEEYCSLSSCHSSFGTYPPLTNFEEVKTYANEIATSIETGYMPVVGTMSAAEKETIIEWIKRGAPNN